MRASLRLSIRGNRERILNRLRLEGISVKNIEPYNEGVTITISTLDKAKTIDIIDNLCYDYEIIDDDIFTRLKGVLVDRMGLIVGFVLMVTLAIMLSFLTLFITIDGTDRVSKDDILAILKSHNIEPFSVKAKDTKSIEDEILSSVYGVSYVSLRYRGSNLYVSIHEELKEPTVKKDNDGNIIANYDGIVTRVIVSSGTAKVKAGDTVKCGDILIEAKRYYGEGDDMQVVDTVASGEVYASVYIHEDIVLSDDSITLSETGRSKRINSLISKVPASPYEHYRLKTTHHILYGIVPIPYVKYEFFELNEEIVDVEKERERLIATAYNTLNMRVLEGERVIRDWIFEKRLDNMHIISVYYEVEKLISGGRLE